MGSVPRQISAARGQCSEQAAARASQVRGKLVVRQRQSARCVVLRAPPAWPACLPSPTASANSSKACSTPCPRRWRRRTSARSTATWRAYCCSPNPCRRPSGCAGCMTSMPASPRRGVSTWCPCRRWCSAVMHELGQAIAARRWFDPWVFELEPADGEDAVSPSDVVLPWVAGFAAALERFPALLDSAGADAREPLATLYCALRPRRPGRRGRPGRRDRRHPAARDGGRGG